MGQPRKDEQPRLRVHGRRQVRRRVTAGQRLVSSRDETAISSTAREHGPGHLGNVNAQFSLPWLLLSSSFLPACGLLGPLCCVAHRPRSTKQATCGAKEIHKDCHTGARRTAFLLHLALELEWRERSPG